MANMGGPYRAYREQLQRQRAWMLWALIAAALFLVLCGAPELRLTYQYQPIAASNGRSFSTERRVFKARYLTILGMHDTAPGEGCDMVLRIVPLRVYWRRLTQSRP